MLDNFYSNLLNFFYNPTSLKDINEVIDFYRDKKHFDKVKIFKDIENANKIETVSDNFVVGR